jgi:hypothetical protein
MPDVALPPAFPEANDRIGGGGRSVGVRGWSDPAAQIWGAHYAGTIPTYLPPSGASWATAPAEGIAGERARAFTSFALGPTTERVWSPSMEHDYGLLGAKIGLRVWGGQYVVAVSTHEKGTTPDLVIWTADRVGGAKGVVVVVEAKRTRTEPVERANAPAWRKIFATYGRATEDPGTNRQEEGSARARDVHADLRLLAEWTRLPVEQLAEMFGASRRTVYNWFSGRPIRDDAQARIVRVSDALAPVAHSRDPLLVREWLVRGDPSPAVLAASGRWADLEERVRAETTALRPVPELTPPRIEQPHAESPEVLKTALLAFSTAPARVVERRPDWRPHEATGILADDEEAVE